jgi:hypothetical protein
MTEKFRHIDTTGLPDGFDVADLIESGVVGEELIAWCKARVRPGPPSLTKEEMRASKPAKPVDIEKKKAVPAQVAGNVVALPEPEPPPQSPKQPCLAYQGAKTQRTQSPPE